MSPEFAEFSTPDERLPRLADAGLVVRSATTADLPAVAELSARREGVDAAPHLETLVRSFGRPETSLMIAALDGRIIGFGKTAYLRPPIDAPAGCIPEGWYLTGLVVHPDARRRGVGHELTLRRLNVVFDRAATARYFATAINTPTNALHERFGFREITREFWAPGASFTGGLGILFGLDRDDYVAAARDGG